MNPALDQATIRRAAAIRRARAKCEATQLKRDLRTKISNNLMEDLVSKEIDRQFKQLSPKMLKFVRADDVMVFALNRLPALYANTKRGRAYQEQKLAPSLRRQIEVAVHQGIVAVQNDPLRSTGDWEDPKASDADKALRTLRTVLKCEQLSWQNLPELVKHRIAQTARDEMDWQVEQVFDWDANSLYCRDI
ncbi:MAG: late competence development ComFB family protein [Cyanobacteria bacterium P01_H01_bin.121]